MKHKLKAILMAAILSLSVWNFAWAAKQNLILVVGFPPGSGTDLVARQAAKDITENSNYSVIVETKVGDGGNIAVNSMLGLSNKDAPRLLVYPSSIYINTYVTGFSDIDLKKDLRPVAMLGYTPMILVASPESKLRTINDVRSANRTLTFGAATSGMPLSSMNYLGTVVKTPLQHIPYKGSTPAMVDLVGNRIDLIFDFYNSTIGFIKAGQVVPVAVTGTRRLADLPDVPTVKEQGIDWPLDAFFIMFASNNIDNQTLQELRNIVSTAMRRDPEPYQRMLLHPDPLALKSIDAFHDRTIQQYKNLKFKLNP